MGMAVIRNTWDRSTPPFVLVRAALRAVSGVVGRRLIPSGRRQVALQAPPKPGHEPNRAKSTPSDPSEITKTRKTVPSGTDERRPAPLGRRENKSQLVTRFGHGQSQ